MMGQVKLFLFRFFYSCCLPAFLLGCAAKTSSGDGFYSAADFALVPKFDTHVHINTRNPALIEQAITDNFRLLTINVAAPGYPTIVEQQELALAHIKSFPKQVVYATTFSVQNWNSDQWQNEVISYMQNSFKKGAIGVKIWKNIGMEFKDKDGSYVMIDDPRIDPVFTYLEKNKVPIIGHLGEPKNCWLPLAEMNVKSNRDYYAKNPQYHMYLHPEAPSYEAHIQARDNVLEKHKDLRFTGAHLGSVEWSVDELGKRLDKYPNLTVDMAARTAHLQEQAVSNWQKVHDFFIKYQDRIIYATDISMNDTQEAAALKKAIHDRWQSDWRFLVTDDKMSVSSIEGEFKGLKLPRKVVDKVYYKNALKAFPGIGK